MRSTHERSLGEFVNKEFEKRQRERYYRYHIWLLFTYILITPLGMVGLPGIGSIMKLLSLLILVLGVLLLIAENAVIQLAYPLALAWTAYVLYTAASIYWSTDFDASFDIAAGLIQILLISLVIGNMGIREDDVRVIENACILTSLICLILFFGGAGQQIEYGGRISIVIGSGMTDPNEFCAYFYLTVAIILTRLLRNPLKIANLFYMFLLLAIFYCILTTGSRGGLMAAASAAAVTWAFATRASVKKLLLLGFLAAVGYLVFVHFIISAMPQGVLERFHLTSIIEDKGSDRLLIWTTAFRDLFYGNIRLIFGYGPFGVTFMRNTMHNQFLQALMDGGLIGLALYLNLAGQLYREAFRKGAVLLGGLTGVFAALLTLSAYAFFKPVWITFLLCLITVRKNEGDQSGDAIEKEVVQHGKFIEKEIARSGEYGQRYLV